MNSLSTIYYLLSTAPRKGQALLPMLMILVLLVGLLGLALGSAAFLQTLQAGQRQFSEQAKAAADSAIRDVLLRLGRDRNFTAACIPSPCTCAATSTVTETLGDATGVAEVPLLFGAQNDKTLTAAGKVRGICRKFEVKVRIPENGNVLIDSWKEIVQ